MSLVATRLLPYIYEQAQQIDKYEHRPTDTPILDRIFVPDANQLITPEVLRSVRGAISRPKQIPVINDPRGTAVTIGSSVTCTIPDSRNTSAYFNVTYVPYVFNIVQYPATFADNYITQEADFRTRYNAGINEIKRLAESQCVTALNNGRNLVWNASTLGPYTQTANALRVPLAAQNLMLNNFTPILAANDFPVSPIRFAAGWGAWPTVQLYMNQGQGNATNTSFQFGNYLMDFTSRIQPGANSLAAGFFFPAGSVGAVDWLPAQFKMRTDGGAYRQGDREWYSFNDASLGMEVGVYATQDCGDMSGAFPAGVDDASQSATPREAWQFTVNIATMVAYNSNPATRVAPIFRFEMNNA